MPDRMSDYWHGVGRRWSRRRVLTSAGAMGMGLAGAALIGCGSNESGKPAATAAGAGARAAAAPVEEKPKRGGVWRLARLNPPGALDPMLTISADTKSFGA